MNEIYNSGSMVVHDDRDFITPEEAFDILWNGKSIMICDPPDYSAELEHDIFPQPFIIDIKDIAEPSVWEKGTLESCKQRVFEFLKGYELSK